MFEEKINKFIKYSKLTDNNKCEISLNDLNEIINILENLNKGFEICFKRAKENYKYSCKLQEKGEKDLEGFIRGYAQGCELGAKIIEVSLIGRDPSIYFK